MTLKEHKYKKHTTLIRPELGYFGRNEWAILGAPCEDIKALAGEIIKALDDYQIAYVDAEHQDNIDLSSKDMLPGAIMEYIKKPVQQFNCNTILDKYQYHQFFNNADMILLNGNHHQGQKQVVIIDAKKKVSLQKRLTQLTNVYLFILAEREHDIFDFIKDGISHWQDIPVYRMDETDKIISFFKMEMERARPQLNALVLTGGKSERMGHDKGAISWHQKEQRYHMADLLKSYTDNVYISCRADQAQDVDPAYSILTDTFTGLGPFGAILSAFREQPEKAWLVIACDLPLLDKATLNFLMANRDTSRVATAFKSPHDGLPEPLITIWEPKSYPVLLAFLSEGYSCPRKVLINSDSHIIEPPQPLALTNVNTPEELAAVREILQQKTTV